MEFGVLGPLLPREVTRPAQKRLLSILLLEAGSSVDRDVLVDRMWGEPPPASARNALQVHISELRKILPDGVIVTTGSGYRIDLEGHNTTVDTFFRLIASADAAQNAAKRHALIVDALDLWRGPPYADLADDDFARPEIVRLNELHLRAQEIAMDSLLDLGRSEEAIPELRRLIGDHPLRERLRGQLMLALYRTGRQAEALREYQATRTVLGEELGIEPSLDLKDLEERILFQDESLSGLAVEAPRTNLPTSDTSFIGRDDAMQGVSDALLESRLVTIVGGPGFGKTRLAVEFGRSALRRFPDGVWFVNLADTRSADDVASLIVSATRLQDEVTDLEEIGKALASHRMLIILDNCEHIRDACATFTGAAGSTEGALRILTTSRTALDVGGERVWHLLPLPVPSEREAARDPAEALASPTVQLFIDRAKAVDRTFSVTTDSAPAIVHLSRRLAGIPLAIELASRWVPALGIADITSMLDPKTDPESDEPDRAATSLRDAIQWSLALLPEEDRELATHAAVFSGPFGLSDIQAICSQDREGPTFAAMMSRVVSSSLLQAERRPDGSARYRMLMPIRKFLLALPEYSQGGLQERFARHYLTKSKDRRVVRFSTVTDLPAIDDDLDSLRTALDIGFRSGWVEDVALALGPMADYFHQRYMILESRSWHQRLLEYDLPPEHESTALRVVASTQAVFGHLRQAADLLARAISVSTALDDKAPQASCLMTLSAVENRLGNRSAGLERAREALALTAMFDAPLAVAKAEYYIGENLLDVGDFAAGRSAMIECAESYVRAGEPPRAAYAETRIAVAAVLSGEPAIGREALDQATALAAGSESDFLRVKFLSTEALCEALDGDNQRASRLILQAHSIIERSHDDDIFDMLLPAAVVFASCSRWADAATLILGVRYLIDRSERAMPIPWDTALESLESKAHEMLAERFDRMGERARLASFDGLTTTALDGLHEVANARFDPA